MRDFRKMEIWNESMDFSIDIYKIQFHQDERFGLQSQIRRSATSIPANIAEGSGRHTDKDFLHFLDIALGSAFETETHLIITHRLQYISEETFKKLVNIINRIQAKIVKFKKAISE